MEWITIQSNLCQFLIVIHRENLVGSFPFSNALSDASLAPDENFVSWFVRDVSGGRNVLVEVALNSKAVHVLIHISMVLNSGRLTRSHIL